jgi:tetratricopeptide (TPR) repeat protein
MIAAALAWALAPAGAAGPALEALDPLVRAQIEERQAWHARTLAAAAPDPQVAEEAHGELGNVYQAYGLHEAAIAAYEQAARLDPRDFRWPYYLALAHRARGERDRAVSALERALALEPGDVPALVRLAEVHVDANRPDLAAPLLEQAIARDPVNAVALAALGQIALGRREHARAADLFTRALAAQPEAAALRYPLGLAYRGLGDAGRARAELERRGDRAPTLDDPLSRRLHGLSAGQAGHQQRGNEAAAAGDLPRAVEEFRRAVAEDPLYSAPRVNLALALLRQGDTKAAEDHLRRALALAPLSPAAHAALGYLEAGRGAHARAAEHYRTALSGEPAREEARYNLAQSLLALRRYADAAAELRRLAADRPESTGYRLAEASALVLAGRDREARERLEQALGAFPRDGHLAHALARLLAASPDPAVRDGRRALEIAQAIAGATRAPDHLETLALAQAEAGRFEEAAASQRALVERLRPSAAAQEIERLTRNLRRYEAGQPVRAPWVETGLFVREP